MGWLITLAILFLIAIFPVGVSAKYDADGLLVRVIASFLRFTIFPFPKKKKKKAASANANKKKENPAPSGTSNAPSVQTKKKGGSITDFMPLVKIALRFLSEFRRKLRVDYLHATIILGADDPCDLAINYGRIWAAVDSFLPALERFITIKERDIEVECDFTANSTTISAQVDLTITIGRIIYLGAVYGFLLIREFLKIRKKRKGGVPA